MVKSFFLLVLVAGLSLAVYLYVYLGVYKSVSVSVTEEGPFYLLYVNHVGAYHEIGPKIQKVEDWARTQNLLCGQTFGEFLDDPEAVDQDRLRSRAGCILSAPLESPPSGMVYEVRSRHRFAVGVFDGSPAIGPFKAYPRIKKFLSEQRLRSQGPVMEIYRVQGSNVETRYLFALDSQAPNGG